MQRPNKSGGKVAVKVEQRKQDGAEWSPSPRRQDDLFANSPVWFHFNANDKRDDDDALQWSWQSST